MYDDSRWGFGVTGDRENERTKEKDCVKTRKIRCEREFPFNGLSHLQSCHSCCLIFILLFLMCLCWCCCGRCCLVVATARNYMYVLSGTRKLVISSFFDYRDIDCECQRIWRKRFFFFFDRSTQEFHSFHFSWILISVGMWAYYFVLFLFRAFILACYL